MADNGKYCVTHILYCIEIARRACVGDMGQSVRGETKTAYDLGRRPGVAEFVIDRCVDTPQTQSKIHFSAIFSC